jgi:antitoxin VapB
MPILKTEEVTGMQPERHVRLFRNGKNQALRIPKEFELEGHEAIIRKDGDRLIVEPVKRKNLLGLLAGWEPVEEDFPEISDTLIEAEDIF